MSSWSPKMKEYEIPTLLNNIYTSTEKATLKHDVKVGLLEELAALVFKLRQFDDREVERESGHVSE